MGRLLDFDYLCYPLTNIDCLNTNCQITYEDFKSIIKKFHFSPSREEDIKSLFFQFKEYIKFGLDYVDKLRRNESVIDLTINVIKQYVLHFKNDHSLFVRFISFIVCFPVSEAIVESWGSSLENIYNKNTMFKMGKG